MDWVTHRIGEITLAKVLCCNLEPDNSAYQKELDNLDMVKRALAQQQADAELLEALKDARISMLDSGYNPSSVIIQKCSQAIARAEQKGGE